MDRREAELAHDDHVIGDSNLARMFHDSVDRHRERKAQMYKGGIEDRSLTDAVVPLAPDGAFTALTYDDVERVVTGLAEGFAALGIEAGDRVGLMAHTRMEWAHCDLALLGMGAAVTTVYPESSEDQVAYLLGDSDASAVVVENAALLDRVLAVEAELGLDLIAVIDEIGDHGASDRDDVVTLDTVHARGREATPDGAAAARAAHLDRVNDVGLDDLASLVYTSGTTGQPKGVRLTHGNLRSNVNQVRRRFAPREDRDPDVPVIDERSRSVSYLPLAHVFERLAGHFLMLASGATVAYAESPDTLREDFGLVAPTVGTSVPRVYEKLYDAIREDATGSGLRERLFGWATGVARRFHEAEGPGPLLRLQHRLADRLVFRKVREALGGELEVLFSGGGSLSPELAALYHGMGLPMVEGYGLTETSPVLAVNPPDAPKIGTVGPPVVGLDVHLDEDVATETSADPDSTVGELLVRGPNVTAGYWEKPEATEGAFLDAVGADDGVPGADGSDVDEEPATEGGHDDRDGRATGSDADEEPATEGGHDDRDGRATGSDREEQPAAGGGGEPTPGAGGAPPVTVEDAGASTRWFRTGDIVEHRTDGYLVFRDRLKELLVLSTGKNVAPLPIENRFATEPLVEQCMVVGDGRKFVGALIVPNLAAVRRRADREDVALAENDAAALADDRVHDWIRGAVEAVNEDFEGFERVKRFELVGDEWTETNGMLTPTMKKKRREILDAYREELEAIYADAD